DSQPAADVADVNAQSAPTLAPPAAAETPATEVPAAAPTIEASAAPLIPDQSTLEVKPRNLPISPMAAEVEEAKPEAPATSAPTPAVAPADASPVDATPASRDDGVFTRYYAVRAHIGPIAFSHDLSQVAYIVNTSGQFNIWRQSIGGGWAAQITTFE